MTNPLKWLEQLGRARSAETVDRATRIRRTRSDDGAAAVETALVLPLLLLLIFGFIDFGRLLNAQITVTQAAREGVRAAALDGDPDRRARTAAGGLDPIVVQVDPCPETFDPEQDTTVVVTYGFDFVTPVGALVGLSADSDGNESILVTGKGVMACLR